MNIEAEAVSKVNEVLRRTGYLDPYITENDKTPVWDGFVLVYNDDKMPHRKDSLRGRFSVQVKGHKSNQLPATEVKYAVNVNDLKAFLKDGGAIFFNVYITPTYTSQIFYRIFLPLDLERILQKSKKQKTLTLDFKALPADKSIILSIFMNFLANQKKQIGTINPTKLYLEDWNNSGSNSSISKITMPVTVFKDPDRLDLELITSIPHYLYITPRDFEHISIPVETMGEVAISTEVSAPIATNSKSYYDHYKIIWHKGSPTIYFGKGLTIVFNRVDGDNNTSSFSVQTTLKGHGTLQERIHDISFFLEIYNDKLFTLNSMEFPIASSDADPLFNKTIMEFEKLLNKFKALQKILNDLQIWEDLDIDGLTKDGLSEEWKIDLLLDIGKKHIYKQSETPHLPIQVLTISNTKILFFVSLEDGYEVFRDYYVPQFEIISKESDQSSDEIHMSQYIILKKANLVVSNFKKDLVLEDIIKYDPNENYLSQVNFFLLEVISAYDSGEGKTEELYKLAFDLSKWLCKQHDDVLHRINYLQVLKRKRSLTKKDKSYLQEQLDIYKDDLYIRLGIYILQGEMEEARKLVLSQQNEEMENFKKYPIYHLMMGSEV